MGSMINIGSCNVSNSGDSSAFENPNMSVNYRRNFDSGPNQMNHAPIIMSRSQKNLGGMPSNRAKPVATLVLPPASRTSYGGFFIDLTTICWSSYRKAPCSVNSTVFVP